MSSHKPPSTRLAMPDPRPAFGGLGFVLLGGIMVATQMTQWRDLGWALIVVGGGMVGWWVSQAWRVVQYRGELDRQAERQAALKITRRQKEDEERAQRDADKKTREDLAARLREQRAEEGRRRKEVEDAAARERAETQARVDAEVSRLKALLPEGLRREVVMRLAQREYDIQELDDDPDGFVLLKAGVMDGVARIAGGDTGRASDVREIEAWRRDIGASRAYLVCLAGFAPDAIRAAQGKPVILVEAHLLAAWREPETT